MFKWHKLPLTLPENSNIYASEYQLYLPSKEELKRQLEEAQHERAFAKVSKPHLDRPYDFPSAVRQEADILKKIYQHRNKYREYQKLCERLGTTPKDCEALAQIYKRKKRDQDALEWVQRGEELEENHEWRNETAYGLSSLRKELLHRLGRTDEVVPIAWEEFEKHPSYYSYETLMTFVPKNE